MPHGRPAVAPRYGRGRVLSHRSNATNAHRAALLVCSLSACASPATPADAPSVPPLDAVGDSPDSTDAALEGFDPTTNLWELLSVRLAQPRHDHVAVREVEAITVPLRAR